MNDILVELPKIYNLNIIRTEAFPILHNVLDKEKIMITEETAHFVTIEKYFKIMLYIIDLYIDNTKTYSLLDGFGGVGSDAISFMIRKKNILNNIVIIEQDLNRFNMLKNNISLYKNDQNLTLDIKIINDDIYNNLTTSYDIIYLDPPWGSNYKKILVNNLSIEELVYKIISQKIVNEIIIIKLPKTYEFDIFKTLNINFSVYEIYKSDDTIYINLVIIYIKPVKKEKIYGWNFKRIINYNAI
jgi:16S rRNA G966 N2-methylase RsmD